MSSDLKAQALAEYFEEIQWHKRLLVVELPLDPLGPVLPVVISEIFLEEVVVACKKLRSGRASGVDGIPAEVWKCLLKEHDHRVALWIIDFYNHMWCQRIGPGVWHQARVTALFKKGDMGNCANYRLISLACICYKLFSIILLNRMKMRGQTIEFGSRSLVLSPVVVHQMLCYSQGE